MQSHHPKNIAALALNNAVKFVTALRLSTGLPQVTAVYRKS